MHELEIAFFLQFSSVFSTCFVMFASGIALYLSTELSESFAASGLTVAGLFVARTTALQGFLAFRVSQKLSCL